MTVMLNKVIGSFLGNGLKNSTSRHANAPHLYASPASIAATREKQNAKKIKKEGVSALFTGFNMPLFTLKSTAVFAHVNCPACIGVIDMSKYYRCSSAVDAGNSYILKINLCKY